MFPAVVVLAAGMSAPVPRDASPVGRITVWAGDTFAHFKPDGTDVTPVPDRNGFRPLPNVYHLTPDRATAVYWHDGGTDIADGKYRRGLVTAPLTGPGKPAPLPGYCVLNTFLSGDGRTAYFSGRRGDETTFDQTLPWHNFAVDLATRTVTPLRLPDRHVVEGICPDGTLFLTTTKVVDGDAITKRSYVVARAGGKAPVEVFGPNQFLARVAIAPGGRRVYAIVLTYESVKHGGGGTFRAGGQTTREHVVYDVVNRSRVVVRPPRPRGDVVGWAWSPDGTRAAVAWSDEHEKPEPTVVVYVADADGKGPREVYKTTGRYVWAFMWR